MNATLITEELLQYISGAFYVVGKIDLDESLIEQEVIDSMGLIEIVCFLEKKFGCAVSDTELNAENFGSINRIANFVLSKSGAEVL